MALYEYTCTKCEHRFERIMKRGARPPRCPECDGRTSREISAPAIHFKGSGWYVTDYANKGKKDGKPAGGKEKKASTSGDEGSKSKADSGKGKSGGKADSKKPAKS